MRPCFIGARAAQTQAEELIADVLRNGDALAREQPDPLPPAAVPAT